MSYDTANPPRLMVPSIGDKPAWWDYSSTDGTTVVVGAGYFTDGEALGMKKYDKILITHESTSAPEMSVGFVTSVSSTGVTIDTGTLTST